MTLEQLQEKYPIGYVYKTEEINHRFYCAHDVVLNKMKDYYGKDNVKMVSPHHAICTNCIFHSVDGYLFDGDEWHLVEKNYSGEWKPINIEEGEN